MKGGDNSKKKLLNLPESQRFPTEISRKEKESLNNITFTRDSEEIMKRKEKRGEKSASFWHDIACTSTVLCKQFIYRKHKL